jgi:hypothetical protein
MMPPTHFIMWGLVFPAGRLPPPASSIALDADTLQAPQRYLHPDGLSRTDVLVHKHNAQDLHVEKT